MIAIPIEDQLQALTSGELVSLLPAIAARYAATSPELNQAMLAALAARMRPPQPRPEAREECQ